MTKTIEVRLVRNDADHQAALERIAELWPATDEDSLAEMDALVYFVDAYEQKIAPFDAKLDPIDILKHAMSDDVGHTRADLVEIVGYPSRVSEILSRKRGLTLDNIRAISAKWNIPIALLIEPYELAKSERSDKVCTGISVKHYDTQTASMRESPMAEIEKVVRVGKRPAVTAIPKLKEVVAGDLGAKSGSADYGSKLSRKRILTNTAERQRLSAKKA